MSSQVIQLSKLIYTGTNQLTGNGSYPLAILGGGADNGNQTQLMIHLIGENALPNLTAKIVTIPDYKQISGLNLAVLGLSDQTNKIGTLRASEMPYFMIDTKSKETAVTIFFKTDNNSWNQSIRISKTNKGRKDFWYIQDKDGVTLKKSIEDNFPKTKDGKVVIWSNEIKSFEEI